MCVWQLCGISLLSIAYTLLALENWLYNGNELDVSCGICDKIKINQTGFVYYAIGKMFGKPTLRSVNQHTYWTNLVNG